MTQISGRLVLLYLVAIVPAVLSDLASGTFKFVRKPSDAEVEKGSPHTVYCTVSPSNIPDIEYTWYKFKEFNEWEKIIMHGKKEKALQSVNASELLIASVDVEDSGFYMCKVSTRKYTIFSDIAYITVLHFDYITKITESQEINFNEKVAYINCNTPKSNPLTTIRWYKVNNGEEKEVDDMRMFIIPSDDGREKPKTVKRGSLAIVNIKSSDEGVYRCKTKYKKKTYELSEVSVTIKGSGSTSDFDHDFLYLSERYITVVRGSELSLYCALFGKPLKTTPQWKLKINETTIDVKGTDTISLSDYNRKLTLGNVQEEGVYNCEIPREGKFSLILPIDVSLVKPDINFIESPTSFALKPNFYSPKKLNCVIEGSGYVIMMVRKNNRPLPETSRILKDQTNKNGTIQFNLVMDQPNESDLGVYQCFVYTNHLINVDSGKRFIEKTAYITLQKEEPPLHRDGEYLYVGQSETVDVAEEYCRDVFDNGMGHLVSILSQEENDKVNQIANLQKDESVRNYWIGLTKEVAVPVANWKWVQPGDSSSVYSNWEEGKPYDLGYQEYAVMNNDTGKWSDVSRRERRPFICKRYLVVCPSVDSFYKGRLRVRGWETNLTHYNVGESVEVYCSDVVTKVNTKTVECNSNGSFTPQLEEINCPDISFTLSTTSSVMKTTFLVFFTIIKQLL